MLEISMVYRFKRGGSVFYASEGTNIKVKLKNDVVVSGVFLGCNSDGTRFQLDNGICIDIKCEDVIDIIPE